MRNSPWLLMVLIVPVAALLALAPAEGARKAVSIKEMNFQPATLEINVGDTVVWTNNDDRDHTVVGPKDTFKSDNLRSGSTFSYQFKKAGVFDYTCSYHPRMKGTIKVTEK